VLPDIRLEPVAQSHEFRQTQVVGVNIRRIFSRYAFVIFGCFPIINAHTVEVGPCFLIGIGPNPRLGLNRFIEVGCSGIRRNDRGLKVIGFHFNEPKNGSW